MGSQSHARFSARWWLAFASVNFGFSCISALKGAWVAPYWPSALVRRAISACEKGLQASKATSKAVAAFGLAPAFVKAGAAASSKVSAEHGVASKTPEEAAAADDEAGTAAEAGIAAGMFTEDAAKAGAAAAAAKATDLALAVGSSSSSSSNFLATKVLSG
jgi:hypothetical protein